MVHISTIKELKALIALDPEHYVVHLGFPWDEVEEDPKARRNLKLEPMKGPWDDVEQDKISQNLLTICERRSESLRCLEAWRVITVIRIIIFS
jgi:hypothetical protein